jgi:hypothetical protein
MTQESKDEILGELGKIQLTLGEHTADLQAIKKQVTKTNGDVRVLKQWKSNVEYAAQVAEKDRAVRQSPITSNFWDSSAFNNMIKIILVLALVVAAALKVSI